MTISSEVRNVEEEEVFCGLPWLFRHKFVRERNFDALFRTLTNHDES
jgi:hypothetical protein